MTNREAIEWFKELIYILENSIMQQDFNTTMRIAKEIDAYKSAIQALEKQGPKKPEVDCHIGDMDCNSYDYHKCPECGTEVYRAYCPECGQALKWVVLDES